MCKRKLLFCVAVVVGVLLAGLPAFGAADSVVGAVTAINHDVMCLTIDWTADSAAGAVTETTVADASGNTITVEGWVFMAVSNPGTPSPTDNYDIYVDDADGCDVFGAELEDRDQVTTEHTCPKMDNAYPADGRFVPSYITFDIENNSVNSATGVLKLYFYRYRHMR